MMKETLEVIELADGRTLSYAIHGDPNGEAVFVHHGTPSSAMHIAPSVAASASRHVLKLITIDRAGYGGSTRDQGRKVVSVVDDVIALSDAMGIDVFGTWGISGGGPHALATAARAGDRVVAVATYSAVAPFDAEGLDFLAGMGEDNLEEFGLAVADHDGLARFLAKGREEMLRLDAEQWAESARSLICDADFAAIKGEAGVALIEASRHGLSDSVDGWFDDDLAFVAPWGFDLSEVTVPALIVHGSDDRMVPVSHFHFLSGKLGHAQTRLLEGEGHLSVVDRTMDEVHGFLAEAIRRTRA
ncbi:MAG: alpha/beta fold hydrolase [Acidimicrobiales bacterium]